MTHLRSITIAAGVLLLMGVTPNALGAGKFLYIQSNDIAPGKNAIIAYRRLPDGKLSPHRAGPFLTRGTGVDNDTNGKLGPNDNDTPVVVSANKRRLYAVNGHSNTIAGFDIRPDGSLRHVNGSPFSSRGVHPSSLSIAGDVLLAANRNEDPHQSEKLRGAANSNYVSFRINEDGSLKHLSTVDMKDGHKSTQVLVSSRNPRIAFGNDFQVDADFDGDGAVSRLFGEKQQVRGRLHSFRISDNPGHLHRLDQQTLPETVSPKPDVPSIPLGIWDHPARNLVYVGLVTRNQLGVYRYDNNGKLSFVTAVDNSGQDICWLKTNQSGTRLFAVNNLPRADRNDQASSVTVFDISGDKAEKPIEIGRTELPVTPGTFLNNRNSRQPDSTAFQFDIDDDEQFLYVISQRANQGPENKSKDGNNLHVLKINPSGRLSVINSRPLMQDGISYRSRPQGVVSVDL